MQVRSVIWRLLQLCPTPQAAIDADVQVGIVSLPAAFFLLLFCHCCRLTAQCRLRSRQFRCYGVQGCCLRH